MRRTWLSRIRRPSRVAWALAVGAALARPALAQQPLPLDPLTSAEREAAIRIATSDARVRALAGSRESDVAYAELYVTKPASIPNDTPDNTPALGRNAEVLISVFGGGEPLGVRVIVDLQRGAATAVTRLGGGPSLAAGAREPVPFSPRELEIARGLALREFAARALAPGAQGEWQVEYLPADPSDPTCPSRRCVYVLFHRGAEYLASVMVVDVVRRGVQLRRGAQ